MTTWTDVSPSTPTYKEELPGSIRIYAGTKKSIYAGTLSLLIAHVATDFYAGLLGTALTYTDITPATTSWSDISPGSTSWTDISPTTTTWTDV